MREITEAMRQTIIGAEADDDESEMIKQLNDKFKTTTERSEQVRILTVLPKSWAMKKIQSEFSATNYMARKIKTACQREGSSLHSKSEAWSFFAFSHY